MRLARLIITMDPPRGGEIIIGMSPDIIAGQTGEIMLRHLMRK